MTEFCSCRSISASNRLDLSVFSAAEASILISSEAALRAWFSCSSCLCTRRAIPAGIRVDSDLAFARELYLGVAAGLSADVEIVDDTPEVEWHATVA